MVFCYEFIGTFVLVGAVNASGGNAAAIGLTLFVLLLCLGPITGGHMNPAVTIGVWINRSLKACKDRTFASQTVQALLVILAQCCGALFASWVFFALLTLDDENGKADTDVFPHLEPHTMAKIQTRKTRRNIMASLAPGM